MVRRQQPFANKAQKQPRQSVFDKTQGIGPAVRFFGRAIFNPRGLRDDHMRGDLEIREWASQGYLEAANDAMRKGDSAGYAKNMAAWKRTQREINEDRNAYIRERNSARTGPSPTQASTGVAPHPNSAMGGQLPSMPNAPWMNRATRIKR